MSDNPATDENRTPQKNIAEDSSQVARLAVEQEQLRVQGQTMASEIDNLGKLVAETRGFIKPFLWLRRPAVLGSLTTVIGVVIGVGAHYIFTYHNFRLAELRLSRNKAEHAAVVAEVKVDKMKLEMDYERLERTNAQINGETQRLAERKQELENQRRQLVKEALAVNEEKKHLAEERARLQRYIANIPPELRELLDDRGLHCHIECAQVFPNLGDEFDLCYEDCMRANSE